MNTQQPPAMPKLDKPGAGIPFWEWLPMRLTVPYVAARSDWDDNGKQLNKCNRKIFEIIDNLPPEKWGTRVLIPRVRGLEDSSRYWSIAMALEHLIIVGRAQEKIIHSLAQGVVPTIKADTASVKPAGLRDPEGQVRDYQDFMATLRPSIDSFKGIARVNRLKFRHPWFGPYTILQWQWMFWAHTYIHYDQIREIAKRL